MLAVGCLTEVSGWLVIAVVVCTYGWMISGFWLTD
jgi:hypothetical protein